MTFNDLKAAVKEYCLLTSGDADLRVGKAINRHYRRITSLVGLDATRFVTRSATTTNGVRTVTFREIEKIDRVLDTTDSTAIRLIPETSVHALRSAQPGSGAATAWALQNTDADSVTVLFDNTPQTTYSLQADGWTTLADLTGTDEPAFPESFHDILTWSVIAEELFKKEKDRLATKAEQKAEKLLSDLRFHLADSHTRETRQGDRPSTAAGGSGGGGANAGGTAYTQTALLTFDRDPDAPFAVTDGSAFVPNLYADGIGNVSTDKLIGRDAAGTGESEQIGLDSTLEFTGSQTIRRAALTGDVTAAAGSNATTIANDVVTYAKLQNVSSASRILGRGSAAGSGDVEELTAGTGLTVSSTTLAVVADTDQCILAAQVFS